MMVFRRRAGEGILIGDSISIQIKQIANKKVVLALDVPRSIRITSQRPEEAGKREFPAASQCPNEP